MTPMAAAGVPPANSAPTSAATACACEGGARCGRVEEEGLAAAALMLAVVALVLAVVVVAAGTRK